MGDNSTGIFGKEKMRLDNTKYILWVIIVQEYLVKKMSLDNTKYILWVIIVQEYLVKRK